MPDHPTIVLKRRTRRRPRTPNNALPALMSARAAREEENRKMEVEFRRQYPLPTWPTVEEIASEFADMGDKAGDAVSDPPTGRAPLPTTQ